MSGWIEALDRPSETFFPNFARELRAKGDRALVREAVLYLVPRLDWAGYLPQMPHGLLGLEAVLELQSDLEPGSFHRLLATQFQALACEARTASSVLPAAEAPGLEAFRALLAYAAPDMANVGHKAAAVEGARRLWETLDRPGEVGGLLLAWTRWVVAAPPEDRFWRTRMARRLDGQPLQLEAGVAQHDSDWHGALAREVCDLGLVALLDALAARMKAGAATGDLLAGLVLAAAEKQLAARRDMEGKTAWNFVYLATVAEALAGLEQPEVWGQAAALVNFFPGEDDPPRWEAQVPASPGALLDAILDGEAELALGLALGTAPGLAIGTLAEAVSRNDPGPNHSHQVLSLAAAARLRPLLPEPVQRVMLGALAKSLANGQGSDELGRRADRALRSEAQGTEAFLRG